MGGREIEQKEWTLLRTGRRDRRQKQAVTRPREKGIEIGKHGPKDAPKSRTKDYTLISQPKHKEVEGTIMGTMEERLTRKRSAIDGGKKRPKTFLREERFMGTLGWMNPRRKGTVQES